MAGRHPQRDVRLARLDQRAHRRASEKGLAVNLDIDNTSLATYYARGKAVPVTLRFVEVRRQQARAGGVQHRSRPEGPGRQRSASCARRATRSAASAAAARVRPRRTASSAAASEFVAKGYTIIANVGNRSTDFVGKQLRARVQAAELRQPPGLRPFSRAQYWWKNRGSWALVPGQVTFMSRPASTHWPSTPRPPWNIRSGPHRAAPRRGRSGRRPATRARSGAGRRRRAATAPAWSRPHRVAGVGVAAGGAAHHRRVGGRVGAPVELRHRLHVEPDDR